MERGQGEGGGAIGLDYPSPGRSTSRDSAAANGPASSAAGAVEDEIAFEPLSGDAIDVGEAVAQQFSLALPPFPRSPDASLDAETPTADEGGPLAAALSRLVDRRGDE